MAFINFNAENVEPAAAYSLLPKGKYMCVAIASDLKPTRDGNGDYIQYTFEVIEGEFKGRKIFERINIRNANKVAEEIAQRTLSALCHATGVMQMNDTSDIHDKPVLVDVKIEAGKNGYNDSNRVVGYEAAGKSAAPRAAAPARQAPAQAQPAQQSAQAPANGGDSTPVWKRKAA